MFIMHTLLHNSHSYRRSIRVYVQWFTELISQTLTKAFCQTLVWGGYD